MASLEECPRSQVERRLGVALSRRLTLDVLKIRPFRCLRRGPKTIGNRSFSGSKKGGIWCVCVFGECPWPNLTAPTGVRIGTTGALAFLKTRPFLGRWNGPKTTCFCRIRRSKTWDFEVLVCWMLAVPFSCVFSPSNLRSRWMCALGIRGGPVSRVSELRNFGPGFRPSNVHESFGRVFECENIGRGCRSRLRLDLVALNASNLVV